MFSPSSLYSAEQKSPPQIMVSFSQSCRRVINPMVPQRGQDMTAMEGFCAGPSLDWFSRRKTVPGSIFSGIHSSRNCKSVDILPSGNLTLQSKFRWCWVVRLSTAGREWPGEDPCLPRLFRSLYDGVRRVNENRLQLVANRIPRL